MEWMQTVEGFAEAATWFVHTAGRVGDRWREPGLGEWDVRALVGHTSRSLLTVESYLAQPAAEAELASSTDYYLATRAISSGPAVAQRGRDAGVALGDDPATAVAQLAARVVPAVRRCTGDELLTTIVGGMRLADYLPTRVFELVVHTLDLAAALDLPVTLPAGPARQALDIVAELAIADGRAGTLLLAATGRTGLPRDFTIL